MKRILTAIFYQYYKYFYYESRIDNRLKGKYRVLYNDGRYSENMCYDDAKYYVCSYGGKIEFINK